MCLWLAFLVVEYLNFSQRKTVFSSHIRCFCMWTVDFSLKLFTSYFFLSKTTTTWYKVLKICLVGLTPNYHPLIMSNRKEPVGSVNGSQSNFGGSNSGVKIVFYSLFTINLRSLVCLKERKYTSMLFFF